MALGHDPAKAASSDKPRLTCHVRVLAQSSGLYTCALEPWDSTKVLQGQADGLFPYLNWSQTGPLLSAFCIYIPQQISL